MDAFLIYKPEYYFNSACAVAGLFLFLIISTTNGVATNNEEEVPNTTPISIAKENPLKISPPKINITTSTAIGNVRCD